MGSKSKNKKVELNQTAIKKLKGTIALELLYIVCACLMDEYDMTGQEIADFSKRFARYLNAVNTKLISVKKVKEILEEEINLEVEFKRWY